MQPNKARLAMLAKGRLKRGEMNDTEKGYADHLTRLQLSGEVLWWRFEGIKFRLCDGAFYTPDFAVMLADGVIEIHETKGNWEGDAKLKIRLAADQFPFRFLAIQTVPKSRGGGWQVIDFSKDDAPLLPGLRDKSVVPPPVKRVKAEPVIKGSAPGDPGEPWSSYTPPADATVRRRRRVIPA